MSENTPDVNPSPQAAVSVPAPEPKPTVRLVAIDIDGTLLDSASQLKPKVEAAVKAAAAQGVQVIMATGKTRGSVAPFLKKLGLNTPGIYVQGTVTANADGSIRAQATLPDHVVRQAITFAEDRGFVVALYSGTRILIRTASARIADNLRFYKEVEAEIVGPLVNQIGVVPINKMIAMGDARAITALRWQLNAQIGEAARVIQAGVPDMLEIIPNGVSKGAALKRLIADLGIAPDQMMAIGDAENDIEMLQLAGVSVAMGNAEDRVKAAAKYVTGTNNEDGVAEALHRFVIVPPPPPAPEPKPEPAAEQPAAPASDTPPPQPKAESAAPASDAPAPESEAKP